MIGEQFFSLIGQLVAAGGGGAVVAFGLFRFLGKSWIENRFARQLEETKAEIGLLAARKMKLHDKEYEVFPEIWAQLNSLRESYGKCVSPVTNQDAVNFDGLNKDFQNFVVYYRNNRIFLRTDIKEKLDEIEKMIRNDHIKKDEYCGDSDGEAIQVHRKVWKNFTDYINPLMQEIENLVQDELFPESQKKSKGAP